MRIFGIVFVTLGVSGIFVHGYPGKLSVQRYEFQQRSGDFSAGSKVDVVTPENPVHIDNNPTPKWSQIHPNEVNAFAEIYRQNYNHLVEQYNRMFGLQNGYVMLVQHQLFHLPVGYTWHDVFGSQQHYVNQQTEQMSRQLFYELQHGSITQQALQAPNFFINQAADLLDQLHDHSMANSNNGADYQQRENAPPSQQDVDQQFNEKDLELVLAFNPATGAYEYVYVQKTQNPSDNVQTLYAQSVPTVSSNNRVGVNTERDIESVESSESIPERNTLSTTPATQTTTNNYYGSTYDQQQVYDIQFLESLSSSSSPKSSNVMSLVRKKPESSSTSTSTTTTAKPTTESNIMSMLPHKQQVRDYTAIQQQIRQAIDQHMKQNNDTGNEETHFMGMSSNQDHVKLTYDLVNQGATRGDQQSSDEGFATDEPVELDTTESTPVTTPQNIHQASAERSTIRPNPSQRIPTESVPLYSAPLAPFPVTVYDRNPYYAAPLAPFPGQMLIPTPQIHEVQFSELDDMNQEEQHFEQEQQAHIPELDDMHQEVQGLEQIPASFFSPVNDHDQQQLTMDHVLGAQLDENQQLASADNDLQQGFLARQQPPEQAYRNPELGIPQAVVPIKRIEESAPIPETSTIEPPVSGTYQKPWLQRQWLKITKHF